MSARYRVLLCNAVVQSGSQTILATIVVSAGRNFVGRYAATTAGEVGAALRLSSPLADCEPQVLRRGHVRRLRSRAPASARLRQRAVLRRMPLVLKFSRYGLRVQAVTMEWNRVLMLLRWTFKPRGSKPDRCH